MKQFIIVNLCQLRPKASCPLFPWRPSPSRYPENERKNDWPTEIGQNNLHKFTEINDVKA